MVRDLTVNELYVGSIPTPGAKLSLVRVQVPELFYFGLNLTQRKHD